MSKENNMDKFSDIRKNGGMNYPVVPGRVGPAENKGGVPTEHHAVPKIEGGAAYPSIAKRPKPSSPKATEAEKASVIEEAKPVEEIPAPVEETYASADDTVLLQKIEQDVSLVEEVQEDNSAASEENDTCCEVCVNEEEEEEAPAAPVFRPRDPLPQTHSSVPILTAEQRAKKAEESEAKPAQKTSLAAKVTKKVTVALALTVLAIVVLALALVVFLLGKMDLMMVTNEDVRTENLLSYYQEEFFDAGSAPSEPGKETMEELPEIILPEGLESMSVPEVVNIILVGTDERTTEYSSNSRGDSITIVSLNTEKKTVKLASMRRELIIPTAERVEHPNADILTSYYRYYREPGVKYIFEKYFGVHIDYYVRVNFNAFVSIVDRMGGVDVELSWAEANYINEQKLVKCDRVKPGKQHLDGSQALIYARIRKIDSNVQRVRRQRTVISQLANKGSELSIADLNDILNSVIDAVQTDMPTDVIIKLMSLGPELLKTDLSSEENYISIPNGDTPPGDYVTNGKELRRFLYGEE